MSFYIYRLVQPIHNNI